MKRRLIGYFLWTCAMLTGIVLSSCVHQFPVAKSEVPVRIHILHDLEWLPDFEMYYTRSDEESIQLRYDIKIYPKGNSSHIIKSFTIYKQDLTRPDFSTDLELSVGEYDVWVWSDLVYKDSGDPIFYDDNDFTDITYLTPYRGDTDLRDAFRGTASLSVTDPGYYEPQTVETTVVVSRPLARYKFIATDLEKFIDRESSRGHLAPPDMSSSDAPPRFAKLSDYKVRVSYPLYMPSVFNNFLNKPVNSLTNVSFYGGIYQISDQEAQIALDYSFVNDQETSTQVMIEIFDPEGKLIAATATIDVPIVRDRTTVVKGKFLTTLRSNGVGIDPDFEGEYNIEL